MGSEIGMDRSLEDWVGVKFDRVWASDDMQREAIEKQE